MIDRFSSREIIQLTDRAIPPAGVIDDNVLNQAIDDAGSIIDGYLTGRIALPIAVADVPVALKRAACDITRYYLYDDAATEAVVNRYKDAKDYLTNIANGRIALGLSAASTAPASANGAQMQSDGKTFGRDESSDFI